MGGSRVSVSHPVFRKQQPNFRFHALGEATADGAEQFAGQGVAARLSFGGFKQSHGHGDAIVRVDVELCNPIPDRFLNLAGWRAGAAM